MSEAALRAGEGWYRLPPGTVPVAPAALRPVPGMPEGMLGLALRQGVAVPVLAPGGLSGPVWLACDGPAGPFLVTGDAVAAPAPPGALPLPMRATAPRPAAPHTSSPVPPPIQPPAAGAPGPIAPRREEALLLHLAGWRFPLPAGALLRVVPLPPLAPPPGRPPGALGLGMVAGEAGAALLLDPAWLDPACPDLGAPTLAGAPLMAVLLLGGRCYALPCDHVTPVPSLPEGAARLGERLAGPEAAPLRALAPPHRLMPPLAPRPGRDLLLARAGTLAFALPVEEVGALVAPQAPAAVPKAGGRLRGVVAHGGDVLPVLDGGEAMGEASVLAAHPAPPLLRLGGAWPVALAVSAVLGLRRWPLADIHPLEVPGLVAALALPGVASERPLPVCRAEALAALLAGEAR
ncbi:chemotaxis protein CheW [Teichococcus rhizosphaerae]|nr:chemotaxis protein CheW [Pseudoroseomonas rhizosphaerae]